MDLKTFHEFLDYYDKVRSRTKLIISKILPDKIDWTYREGKFTLGDLIRHLACIERMMYAENAQGKPSHYKGCGKEYGATYVEVLHFLDTTHAESMKIFYALSEEQINAKCLTPGNSPITVWKWLRLMAEHEIHHRGQIYLYLSLMGVEVPALYGLTSEEVASKAAF
ncbi:MAG TPA: DinB family protein [Chitinophagales bacterium]|nr:DinB family protein [Chitinophagales bacterium]